MRIYEIRRNNAIKQIYNSLLKAEKEARRIDWEKLEKFVIVEFSISRRTAREYIEIAKLQLEHNADKQIQEGSG